MHDRTPGGMQARGEGRHEGRKFPRRRCCWMMHSPGCQPHPGPQGQPPRNRRLQESHHQRLGQPLERKAPKCRPRHWLQRWSSHIPSSNGAAAGSVAPLAPTGGQPPAGASDSAGAAAGAEGAQAPVGALEPVEAATSPGAPTVGTAAARARAGSQMPRRAASSPGEEVAGAKNAQAQAEA